MITNKESFIFYLQEDRKALGYAGQSKPRIFGDEVWKFQIVLRKREYYTNIKQTPTVKIKRLFYAFLHHNKGIKLGFSIPINVFGPGLRINHTGLLIVNPNAKIGGYCDIHQGVNIGQNKDNDDVPTIGDNVYIGPGVKMYGKINVPNKVAIGANTVVNKDILEEDVTIAGVPARVVKKTGTSGMNVAANPKFHD